MLEWPSSTSPLEALIHIGKVAMTLITTCLNLSSWARAQRHDREPLSRRPSL
jgi:hypothetical protein